MTLINFLTRVHFADGVLEEALHSEIEANKKKRPLVLSADARYSNLSVERFYSGFPRRVDPIVFSDVPHLPTEKAAQEVAALYENHDCDVLVAFGANHVIDLAKTAAVAITYSEPLQGFSLSEGGSRRIRDNLPEIYAVPTLLGFPSAMTDYVRLTLENGRQAVLYSRNLIPRIAICDPTLTLGATSGESASAAAEILARGIDCYVSPRYHPPADGLALDALNRTWTYACNAVAKEDPNALRELMAAGLNGSFSLQKGPSAIDALANAIAINAKTNPKPGLVSAILIAHVIKLYETHLNERFAPVKYALRIEPEKSLANGVFELLSRWPIPRKLSDLGVELGEVSSAAKMAAEDYAMTSGPQHLGYKEIRDVFSHAH